MLYDTNILIAYLKGEHAVVELVQQTEGSFYISVITTIEVLALPKLSKIEIGIIREFLKNFKVVALDEELAIKAALLCREFRLKIPDSIIAATALRLNVPLVSRDKDFRRVENVEIVEI